MHHNQTSDYKQVLILHWASKTDLLHSGNQMNDYGKMLYETTLQGNFVFRIKRAIPLHIVVLSYLIGFFLGLSKSLKGCIKNRAPKCGKSHSRPKRISNTSEHGNQGTWLYIKVLLRPAMLAPNVDKMGPDLFIALMMNL